MKRWAAIALVLGACASLQPGAHPPCSVDTDCTTGQICFPNGCGDPGAGVAVEVTGDSTQGLNAQDFDLGDAGFAAVQDFELLEPMVLSGHFQRNAAKPVPYTEPTSLVLTGQSALIPGVNRTYQASFAGSDQGSYSFPIGSGIFNALVLCGDTSVPPVRETGLHVNPGESPALDFQFPSQTATIILGGHLIRNTVSTIPPTQINLTSTQQAMDIIALNPGNQNPLSQLTHVSSGLPISDGSFQIFIDPSARQKTEFSAITLLATPHDPSVVMASKAFTLVNSGDPMNPYPTIDQLTLEMGDFGDPLPDLDAADAGMGVKPRVLTSDGLPVPNATVSLTGPVAGGGTFTSIAVTTKTDGTFDLSSLPSDPRQSFTLTVIPPTSNPAGITKRLVSVFAEGGLGKISPGDIYCDDKVTVTGTLNRPDGTPAASVLVTATPLSALPEDPNQPLPTSVMQTNTDASGQFSMLLDPRVWRFDFTPGEALPISSRVVPVRRSTSEDAGGAILPLDLQPYPLHKGRQVSGHVSLPASQGGGAAQYATVRFFHVDTVEQQASAVLIGEAVCDVQGNYTVVLPTADR